MAITDIRTPGSRMSMTDARRWGRRRDTDVVLEEKPLLNAEPDQHKADNQISEARTDIVDTAQPEAGNVDLTLRDRIRRLSRKNERSDDDTPMRRTGERGDRDERVAKDEVPVTSFQQAPPRDRAAEAQQQRAPRTVQSRQSARPRADRQSEPPREESLPATRRTTSPEPHTEQLVAVNDEVDALRDEIKELRSEMAEMRKQLSTIGQQQDGGQQGGGVRAVEKAVQRLAERMNAVDGGGSMQPQIAEARAPRKIGLMERLFGR